MKTRRKSGNITPCVALLSEMRDCKMARGGECFEESREYLSNEGAETKLELRLVRSSGAVVSVAVLD